MWRPQKTFLQILYQLMYFEYLDIPIKNIHVIPIFTKWLNEIIWIVGYIEILLLYVEYNYKVVVMHEPDLSVGN